MSAAYRLHDLLKTRTFDLRFEPRVLGWYGSGMGLAHHSRRSEVGRAGLELSLCACRRCGTLSDRRPYPSSALSLLLCCRHQVAGSDGSVSSLHDTDGLGARRTGRWWGRLFLVEPIPREPTGRPNAGARSAVELSGRITGRCNRRQMTMRRVCLHCFPSLAIVDLHPIIFIILHFSRILECLGE